MIESLTLEIEKYLNHWIKLSMVLLVLIIKNCKK